MQLKQKTNKIVIILLSMFENKWAEQFLVDFVLLI